MRISSRLNGKVTRLMSGRIIMPIRGRSSESVLREYPSISIMIRFIFVVLPIAVLLPLCSCCALEAEVPGYELFWQSAKFPSVSFVHAAEGTVKKIVMETTIYNGGGGTVCSDTAFFIEDHSGELGLPTFLLNLSQSNFRILSGGNIRESISCRTKMDGENVWGHPDELVRSVSIYCEYGESNRKGKAQDLSVQIRLKNRAYVFALPYALSLVRMEPISTEAKAEAVEPVEEVIPRKDGLDSRTEDGSCQLVRWGCITLNLWSTPTNNSRAQVLAYLAFLSNPSYSECEVSLPAIWLGRISGFQDEIRDEMDGSNAHLFSAGSEDGDESKLWEGSDALHVPRVGLGSLGPRKKVRKWLELSVSLDKEREYRVHRFRTARGPSDSNSPRRFSLYIGTETFSLRVPSSL
jgi:hypothetical protein